MVQDAERSDGGAELDFGGCLELYGCKLDGTLRAVAIPPRNEAELQALLEARIPEGQSLEYKELSLKGRNARVEALKDLSGMGNGGGGVVLYGVTQDPTDRELPGLLSPILDARAMGILEDVVRSGVSPPLLWEPIRIDLGRGYVLAADVAPSALGPYMVHGYEEQRFYRRHGSRVDPMSEGEVRDAYALAERSRGDLEDRWQTSRLPMAPPPEWGKVVCYTVAALPIHGGRREYLPLRPDGRDYLKETQCQLLMEEIPKVWARGLLARSDAKKTAFRIDRDGALGSIGLTGVKSDLPGTVGLGEAMDWLDARFRCFSLLWQQLGFRETAQLRFTVVGEDKPVVASSWGRTPYVQFGEDVPSFLAIRDVLPSQLTEEVRSALAREFAELLSQAFGQ